MHTNNLNGPIILSVYVHFLHTHTCIHNVYICSKDNPKERGYQPKSGRVYRDSREGTGKGLEGEGEGRSDVIQFQFKCIKINHKEKPE